SLEVTRRDSESAVKRTTGIANKAAMAAEKNCTARSRNFLRSIRLFKPRSHGGHEEKSNERTLCSLCLRGDFLFCAAELIDLCVQEDLVQIRIDLSRF